MTKIFDVFGSTYCTLDEVNKKFADVWLSVIGQSPLTEEMEMQAELDDWQSRFDASLILPDWLTHTGSYKLTGSDK